MSSRRDWLNSARVVGVYKKIGQVLCITGVKNAFIRNELAFGPKALTGCVYKLEYFVSSIPPSFHSYLPRVIDFITVILKRNQVKSGALH